MLITYEDISKMREDGMTWNEIGNNLSEQTGLNPINMADTARHVYRRKGKATLTPVKPVDDSSPVTDIRKSEGTDGTVTSELTSVAAPDMNDEAGLLAYHGYDPAVFHVKESVSSVRNGRWTSRIKVLPRQYVDVSEQKLMEAFTDAMAQMPVVSTNAVTSDTNRYAVLPLYDVHFGRQYAMNGRIFDHTDTTASVLANTAQFLQSVDMTDVDGIVVVFGQDFLNSDNIEGSTTKGTKQDNSLPWHEMFAQGLVLACRVVDMCCEHHRVHVIYSEGNHDRMLSYCMAQALHQRYLDSPSVIVDDGAQSRKYFNTGNTLLGFSHNSEEAKLSMVMQSENPSEWGTTRHHYWLTGHVHHLEMYDTDGVTIIRCPSPTFPDEWTIRKGFVGTMRKQSAFVFGDDGMEAMWLFGN